MKPNKYREIMAEQPPKGEYFFAFSHQQFEEGLDNAGIRGQKILSGGGGLYGTKEGLDNLFAFYKNQEIRISHECHPQEVYTYEYANHECGYANDDTEAIDIVVQYFGKEKARSIKRRCGYKIN